MDKKHINLINEHFEELIEVTHNVHKIVDKLMGESVLNRYMADIILKKYLDDKRRAKELYQLIQGRGPHAFSKLFSALRSTENYRAEEILSSLKVSYFSPSAPPDVPNIIRPKLRDEKDDLQFIEPGKLVVKIHPERKFMDIDEQNKPLGTFRMRSKPRGLALIINIYKADGYDDRLGSKNDVEKLQKLFTDIGYKITTRNDLTLKEMKQEIIAFSTNPELSKVDSVVVFTMSHGRGKSKTEESEVVASDGKTLETKWITEQFTASNCPLVTKEHDRKPKIFFFQSCRIISEKKAKFNMCTRQAIESDSMATTPRTQSHNRDVEDIIIVHSTIHGYYSMREPTEGAWFVNLLCRIIAENAWEHDLLTMLGLVDEELRTKHDDTYGHQTMEIQQKGGMSKKIYFNPGL